MKPDWQRPPGVSRGVWEYIHSRRIADGYDEHLRHSRWATVDLELVRDIIASSDRPTVVDFGCGTGRTLDVLGETPSIRWLGIDLSPPMLAQVHRRLRSHSRRSDAHAIRANLVELDALESNIADIGLCLFSTLGMIADRSSRHRFLQQAARIVKPEGQFLVHAHNLWHALRFPGGLRWCLSSITRAILGQGEFGDRFADFHDARQLKLRHFRYGEFRKSLQASGFQITSVWRLNDEKRAGYRPWHALNTAGWILVCHRARP